MPLTSFSCPGCQKVLKTSQPAPGKMIKCPSCQTSFAMCEPDAIPTLATAPAPAAVRAASSFRFDADDEVPRPRTDVGAPSTARPLPARRRLIPLALAGMAMGLVVFLVTGLAWPGFLRTIPSDPHDPLRFLPASSSFVVGADLTRFHGDPRSKKRLDGLLERMDSLTIHQKRFLAGTDKVLIAGDVGPTRKSMAVFEGPGHDPEQVERAWRMAAEQTSYWRNPPLVKMPDARTVLLGFMPDAEFHRLLDNRQVSLPPSLAATVRESRQHALWGVLALDGEARARLRKLQAEMGPIAMASAAEGFAVADRVSLASFFGNMTRDGKSANVALTLTCASPEDARKGAAMLKQAPMILRLLSLMRKGSPGADIYSGIAVDLDESLKIQTSDSTITAFFTLKEATLTYLENPNALRTPTPRIR